MLQPQAIALGRNAKVHFESSQSPHNVHAKTEALVSGGIFSSTGNLVYSINFRDGRNADTEMKVTPRLNSSISSVYRLSRNATKTMSKISNSNERVTE